jgi:hypothetical protein
LFKLALSSLTAVSILAVYDPGRGNLWGRAMRHSRHQFAPTPQETSSSSAVRFSVQIAEMVIIAGAVWVSYIILTPWIHP